MSVYPSRDAIRTQIMEALDLIDGNQDIMDIRAARALLRNLNDMKRIWVPPVASELGWDQELIDEYSGLLEFSGRSRKIPIEFMRLILTHLSGRLEPVGNG